MTGNKVEAGAQIVARAEVVFGADVESELILLSPVVVQTQQQSNRAVEGC